MLPKDRVVEFWSTVRTALRDRYKLSDDNAGQAISLYRSTIVPKSGEMTYHRDRESIAETVAAGWNSGLLQSPQTGVA